MPTAETVPEVQAPVEEAAPEAMVVEAPAAPADPSAWWLLPSPERKAHREARAQAWAQCDAALERVQAQAEEARDVLEKSKPKDWWTMPTPARKNKRKSVAARAERQSATLAQMQAQLASAQASLERPAKRVKLDVDFDTDTESETEEAADAVTPSTPKWTLANLPVKKTDTFAKLQGFAKKQSGLIGTIKGNAKGKDAFFDSLVEKLQAAGLLQIA